MHEPQIKDIPTLQDILKQTQGVMALKRTIPWISPLLKLMGIDTDKMQEKLEIADELAKKAQELAALPDQFNNHFSNRGWIIYESLNLETAKQAVILADNGDIEAGEQVLVNYFTPNTVGIWLNQMKEIKAFQSRIRLARLALQDYEADRYHACIPVILALLDGLVNELNGGHGFFSYETNLEAWDSISAHKQGLVQLGNIFRKGRNKTRTETIYIPYRNGIMHGTDLGYDNKIVAAKVWAALFAVRDWALKVEQDRLEEPPPNQNLSFIELFKQIQKTHDTKEQLGQWEPRIFSDEDIPKSENPKDYPSQTPEHQIVEFLALWEAKNYGHMANYIQVSRGKSPKEMPKAIRETFGTVELIRFQILHIEDAAAAATNILVKLEYELGTNSKEKDFNFRLLYLNADGKAEVRSEPGHRWIISNWNHFHPY